MKKSYWILAAVAVVLCLAVSSVWAFFLFRPLGPVLVADASPTPLPLRAETPTPVQVEILPSATTSGAGSCGSGVMTFLILGESSPEDIPPRGSDAIRLAKVDFDAGQVTMLALPADLWVNTPALNSYGIGGARLTIVYYEAKRHFSGNARDGMIAATSIFAQTLNSNFGFFPEHYLTIKQQTLADVVDALGGIDITLPVAVDGRAENFGYFPAGTQHLTGAQVRDFVRILNPVGDPTPTEAERFERQNLVLQAIMKALLLPRNWDQIPSLVDLFQQDVATDLSPKQILDLACLMNKPGLVIRQLSVGPDLLVSGSHQELLPNGNLVRDYILQNVGK